MSNISIYQGKCRNLYCYSNLNGLTGWFPDVASFRKQTGAKWGVRCAHDGVEVPKGFRATGRGLANDYIEPVPTVKDLVNALSSFGQ